MLRVPTFEWYPEKHTFSLYYMEYNIPALYYKQEVVKLQFESTKERIRIQLIQRIWESNTFD